MNKKIKALLIIGVLALVALTSSCKSDNKAPKGDQTAETYQGKPGTFTIRFSVPSGDPVKYNLRMTQDKREYSIDKVTLYIFEKDKLALDPITISNPQLTADPNDPTAMSYTYTSADNSIPQGLVDIYAVANEELTTPLTKGDDISTLTEQTAKGVQKSGESSSLVVNGDGKTGDSDKIPMVGVKKGVLLFKQNVTLPLERIVARIDIKNNVANDQLNITSVTLENAIPTSLLVDDKIPNSPHGSRPVRGVKPFLFTDGSKQMEHKKVFYLYEGVQVPGYLPTSVIIEGTFRGVPKQFKIPFFDTKNNKCIEIVRNTIYRIVLGTDYSKNNLSFKIEVADWDGPINTVKIWEPIEVTLDKGSNGFTYDEQTHKLTAPKSAGKVSFSTLSYLNNTTIEYEVEASAKSWLTITKKSSLGVELQVADATTTARQGLVTMLLKDLSNGTVYTYQIIVCQEGK